MAIKSVLSPPVMISAPPREATKFIPLPVVIVSTLSLPYTKSVPELPVNICASDKSPTNKSILASVKSSTLTGAILIEPKLLFNVPPE